MKACTGTLASACHRFSEQDLVLHILSCLGNEYDPVMVTITSRQEPYTLQDVGALLKSFETRLEKNNTINTDGSIP